MGTGKSVPAWVGEIQIIERTGWTERELYEDNSLLTILRMNYLNEMRAKAEEMKRRGRGRASGSSTAVKEFEFHA